MSKEDDRREADDLELVLGAASFCLDARTLEEWEGWMVEHEAPFAGMEAKDEHKLEHTEIHAEFVELVFQGLLAVQHFVGEHAERVLVTLVVVRLVQDHLRTARGGDNEAY